MWLSCAETVEHRRAAGRVRPSRVRAGRPPRLGSVGLLPPVAVLLRAPRRRYCGRPARLRYRPRRRLRGPLVVVRPVPGKLLQLVRWRRDSGGPLLLRLVLVAETLDPVVVL